MTEREIRVFGVVGAGQMGRGIAQVAAASGLDVRLADASQELAAAGKDRVDKALAKLVGKGKLEDGERTRILDGIQPVATLDDLAGADLVVEAAPERFELKADVFRALDGVLGDAAILATNTSSISVTKLAAATKRPDRVVGMHFFNPVPVMKLVEAVRALQTSDETFATVRRLGESMGKTVIEARDSPGFIVNRMLVPFLNEACFALAEGLGTPEEIDQGALLGLNHPIGPLALADLVGLDTMLAIAEVLHQELGDPKYRPAPILRQYVAAGWLGRKSGRGFFPYDGG
ncbi:MAG TPA: 3-hydroxybutyryl-CoA dehydrogenase [Polyangiaceae bacterium LLY-WYZ-14_1]|nr:3-hydroxybutyryl-CoA dehydrogenase [Polyangiaceae bacterium LLY-WYZ-14_1]